MSMMITILLLNASKGSSTFEFIRRVLSIHTNPYQALTDICKNSIQERKLKAIEHYKGKSESDQKRAQQSR